MAKLDEELVLHYQDWLIKMTGLFFTKEQTEYEILSEIQSGNTDKVKERVNSVLLSKKKKEKRSVTWQDILLGKTAGKGEGSMNIAPNKKESYEDFSKSIFEQIQKLVNERELPDVEEVALDMVNRKWETPSEFGKPVSGDHRILITAENSNSQVITVDLMHVYCDYIKNAIAKDEVVPRMVNEINRAMAEHVRIQNELHGEEMER